MINLSILIIKLNSLVLCLLFSGAQSMGYCDTLKFGVPCNYEQENLSVLFIKTTVLIFELHF